jgi:hypothetical protein
MGELQLALSGIQSAKLCWSSVKINSSFAKSDLLLARHSIWSWRLAFIQKEKISQGYWYRTDHIRDWQLDVATILPGRSFSTCKCINQYDAHSSYSCDGFVMDSYPWIRNCCIQQGNAVLLNSDTHYGGRVWGFSRLARCRACRRATDPRSGINGAHQSGIIVNQDSLSGINWFDILILLLFLMLCFSLFEKAGYNHKVWFLIACSMILLGMIVFTITKLAGRSSFMASGVIISSLFFTDHFHKKLTAFIGILANVLLLIGDFTVGAGIKIFTILFAAGYILLIIWASSITNTLLNRSEIKYTGHLPPVASWIRPE